MSIEDDVARMRAEGAQAKAGTAELAGSIATFYRGLCTDGVPQEYAREMTLHWMSLMAEGFGEDDE